jgi:hypothetical protein
MDSNLSKLRAEIKKELIDYYDSITNKLDIRAQQFLILLEQENNDKYDEVKSINEKYRLLLKKIEHYLNTNLNEINNYFDSLKNEDDVLIISKQGLKQAVLSCYLTYIEFDSLEEKLKNIHELGFILESDWVINENELNYIR